MKTSQLAACWLLALVAASCDDGPIVCKGGAVRVGGGCDCPPDKPLYDNEIDQCVSSGDEPPVDGSVDSVSDGDARMRDAGLDASDSAVSADTSGDTSLSDAMVDVGSDAANACVPGVELCNGKDDDCDTLIDEEVSETPIGTACNANGQGACAVSGKYVCSGGAAVCSVPVMPQPEVCDGIDNDCMNGVDDAFPDKTKACTVGTGDCTSTGVYECDPADPTKLRCTAVEKPKNACGVSCGPVPAEDCSTPADDNCNGKINDVSEGCTPPAPADVRQLSAGGKHTCALIGAGTVKCWGDNSSGQLGDGTTQTSGAPRPVVGITNAVKISAGDAHTCALLADKTVACWGSNSNGQLGDGTANPSSSPKIVPGVSAATALSAGGISTCAISADKVYCWGWGQNPSPAEHYIPTGNFQEVEVGGDTACARYSYSFTCWGASDSSSNPSHAQPPESSPGNTIQMALGLRHGCSLRDEGFVECWGDNDMGQRGIGNFDNASINIVSNVGSLAGAIELAAGNNHSCARTSAGALRCWGANAQGQLGNGGVVNAERPVIVASVPDPVELTVGGEHTCARTASKEVKCWGANASGQLGDGTTVNRPTAVAVRGL